MSKKSKPKGGRGEREVCKMLSDCFNASFIRSANSGAYVGGVNVVRKLHLDAGQVRGLKGDIFPPDELPRMVIECKLYADFSYHQFVSPKPVALLDDWLEQAEQSVDDTDFWFLTFRADRRDWAIALPAHHLPHLKLTGTRIFYTAGTGGDFIITNFATFLTNNRDYMIEMSK